MKKCSQCEETKPRSEFYKHKENKDGLRGKCKTCWCKDTAKYQYDNPDKYSKYSKKYNKSDKGKAYIKKYRKTQKCKEVEKRNAEKYKRKNPKQYKAQQFLHDHVRWNKITKPTTCSLCGVKKDISKIHGHHWSYLEDHWLDVVWCCSQCHSDIHRNNESDILNRQQKQN